MGGDYYDYLKVNDKGIVLTVGDATAHGLRSGIIVAAVRSYFQLCAEKTEPGPLLSLISRCIEGMRMEDIFMALVVMRYDGKVFKIASAGMPPVLWYKAGEDRLETIHMESIHLGSSLMRTFPEHELDMKAGDMLIMMSDGFTECRNENYDMLPAKLVQETALKGARMSCEDVVVLMQQLQREWTSKSNLEDDSTILALRYKGKQSKEEPERYQEFMSDELNEKAKGIL